MIRGGGDYYLTGTTMHTMPSLPILHSKDLVNWRFLSAPLTTATAFLVVDRGLGRIALQSGNDFLSMSATGQVTLRPGEPTVAETFPWIEALTGELTLLSLATHCYLRFDAESGRVCADHPGPQREEPSDCRLRWQTVP